MKAILANLQTNGNVQGAMAQRGAVCEKQTHCVWLGGTQHGNTAWADCCKVWRQARIPHSVAEAMGEGYSLSLSLSLSRCSFICLVRSFGLGFLAFLNFSIFSNPFTRFSFDFVAKFANSQRFFTNFIQIFTQKFTDFTRFYGLLRRLCRLAMTGLKFANLHFYGFAPKASRRYAQTPCGFFQKPLAMTGWRQIHIFTLAMTAWGQIRAFTLVMTSGQANSLRLSQKSVNLPRLIFLKSATAAFFTKFFTNFPPKCFQSYKNFVIKVEK